MVDSDRPQRAPGEPMAHYVKHCERWQQPEKYLHELPYAPPAKLPSLDAPRQYLTSWRAILVALGMKSNAEDRERVRHLNATYEGPILIPKQGAQPKVDKAKLVEWWNGLEAQWTTGRQPGRDAQPTIEAQYSYGRDGVWCPKSRAA